MLVSASHHRDGMMHIQINGTKWTVIRCKALILIVKSLASQDSSFIPIKRCRDDIFVGQNLLFDFHFGLLEKISSVLNKGLWFLHIKIIFTSEFKFYEC